MSSKHAASPRKGRSLLEFRQFQSIRPDGCGHCFRWVEARLPLDASKAPDEWKRRKGVLCSRKSPKGNISRNKSP